MPEISKDIDSLFDCIKHFLSTLRSISDSTLHYAASNIGNKVIKEIYCFFGRAKM